MRRRPHPGILRQDVRRRLNPGGDRQANHALWRIVFTRLGSDPATRAYAERRTAEGKSKKEIIRCLKRYVAREVYPHLRAGATRTPRGGLARESAAALAGLRTIRRPSPGITRPAERDLIRAFPPYPEWIIPVLSAPSTAANYRASRPKNRKRKKP